MIRKSHAVIVHGITDLTLFGNGSLALRGLVGFIFHPMLVGIYHQLPCRKAEKHDPRVDDM